MSGHVDESVQQREVATCLEHALTAMGRGVPVATADYKERLGDHVWYLVLALRAHVALGFAVGEPAPALVLYPWTCCGYAVHADAGSWHGGPAFAATDPADGRPVLLLFPDAEVDREADVGRRLQVGHPALARPVGSLEAGGRRIAVLAEPHGTRLPSAPAASAFPTTDDAVREFCGHWAELAEALHWLHEGRLLHGRIGPQAVMALEGGGFMLLDAASPDDDAKRRAAVAGIPVGQHYASPEELLGEGATAAADIYALAAVAYDMLAGRLGAPPRDTPPRRTAPSRATELAIPGKRLRRIVASTLRRALEMDPGRRYPTAAALATDLRRASRTSTSSWLRG